MLEKKRTKIIATLGPASAELRLLVRILNAGADAVRINASHQPRSSIGHFVRLVRKASALAKKPVCIFLDLSGPKIRTGTLIDHSPILLHRGQELFLTAKKVPGTVGEIHVSYPRLSRIVRRGSRILMDDGRIELRVLSIQKHKIRCTVSVGGLLNEHKGVNLPGKDVPIRSFTAKDAGDLAEGIRHGIDAVAVSFVQKAQDVTKVKQFLKRRGVLIPVIAKIEKPQAVENFDSILKVSDAVMVARGDLGIEMPAEQVPLVQKELIFKANTAEIPIITATQMLESMVENPRPTRAEASDVANAVLDGTDAVMLSSETAVGHYPLQAVEIMSAIIRESEAKPIGMTTHAAGAHLNSPLYAIAAAGCETARQMNAAAILVFTRTGKSALVFSKLRPTAPIIAFTPSKEIVPALSLLWGVTARHLLFTEKTDEMVEKAKRAVLKEKLLRRGEIVVVACGSKRLKGMTNFVKLDRL